MDRFTYDEETSAPLLPIAPCQHDPADKDAAEAACSRCKSALKLELRPSRERCVFGTPALPTKHGGGSKEKKLAGKGGGAFRVLEERCENFAAKVNKKVAAVTSDAGKMLCSCAGCCDPPAGKPVCYWPQTSIIKEDP